MLLQCSENRISLKNLTCQKCLFIELSTSRLFFFILQIDFLSLISEAFGANTAQVDYFGANTADK